MLSPVMSDGAVVGPANSHILETEVGDDISLYDPETEQVTVLNGTASDIWRLADGNHTIDEITELLASSYQLSPADIAGDVAKTVTRLADAGLLESP